MKSLKRYLIPTIMGFLALHSLDANAEVAANPTYLPNINAKSLTTPVAWGASNNVIFVGVGGTTPSPYYKITDGAAELGVGIGDPKQNLGVQLSIVSLDVSAWGEYSAFVHIFRDLGNANAIGAGVENVMITNGGDSGKSFYVVYSQGLQGDPFVDKVSRNSKLTYSVGVGLGAGNRFGNFSPRDLQDRIDKSEHGTYVFGNISYEVARSFNVITDWNGLNLNAGVSKTFKIDNVPVALVLGAADLTKNSGTQVRAIGAIATGFKF